LHGWNVEAAAGGGPAVEDVLEAFPADGGSGRQKSEFVRLMGMLTKDAVADRGETPVPRPCGFADSSGRYRSYPSKN
jgi:hypothetical protein